MRSLLELLKSKFERNTVRRALSWVLLIAVLSSNVQIPSNVFAGLSSRIGGYATESDSDDISLASDSDMDDVDLINDLDWASLSNATLNNALFRTTLEPVDYLYSTLKKELVFSNLSSGECTLMYKINLDIFREVPADDTLMYAFVSEINIVDILPEGVKVQGVLLGDISNYEYVGTMLGKTFDEQKYLNGHLKDGLTSNISTTEDGREYIDISIKLDDALDLAEHFNAGEERFGMPFTIKCTVSEDALSELENVIENNAYGQIISACKSREGVIGFISAEDDYSVEDIEDIELADVIMDWDANIMHASAEDSLDGLANNEVIRVDAKKTAENTLVSGDAEEGTVRTTYTVPIEIYSDVDLRSSNSVNSIISRLEWHDTLGSTELDLGTASDNGADELINGYMTDYLYNKLLDYWNKKCLQIPSGSELVNLNDEKEFEKYLADTLNGANFSVSDMDGSSMSGKIESYIDKLRVYLQEEITEYFDNVYAYLSEGDEKVAFNDNQEFETYLTNALEVVKSSLNNDLEGMVKEEQIEEYINNTKDSLYAGVLPYWEDIFLQPLDNRDESARVYFTSEQEFKDYLVDATEMWVYDIYDDDGIRTGTRISIVADYEKNSDGMSLNFKNILTGNKEDSFNIGILEIPVKASNSPRDNGDGTFTVSVNMSNKAWIKAMGYNSQGLETDLNYCVENGNIGIVWDGCTNCLTEEDLNQGYRESEIYAEVICEGEGEYTYGTLTPPDPIVTEKIEITKYGEKHWTNGGFSSVLSGAKFGLYKVVNGVEELVESADSDNAGKAVFDVEVPKKGEPSVSYVVREISAPTGFEKTSEYLSFTLPNTTGSAITKTFWNYEEEPEYMPLTIEKRDKDTKELIQDSNTKFKMIGSTGYNSQEYTWASFSTGKMTQNMYVDMGFVITETGVPTGYDNFHTLDEPVYEGGFPANGVITIYNSKGVSTKIVKKDQFTGEILDGWKFMIEDNTGHNAICTSSSNSFVLRDGTYNLVEMKAPTGYEGDGKEFTLVISGAGTANESVKIGSTVMKKVNGVYELVIENMPIIVDLWIYKRDENGKVIQSPVTMIINGEEETFTGSIFKLIRYGQSVTIKETEAPEGYYLNSTPKTYSYFDAIGGINVTNERYKYKVKINKVNEAGAVISSDSTKFDLTYGEKKETRQVTFTGTYTLTLHEEDFPLVYKEVKAPDGYYKDDTEYTINFEDAELYEAGRDNVTVIEVVNKEIPYHEVNIVKVDENNEMITSGVVGFQINGHRQNFSPTHYFIGSVHLNVREDEFPLIIQEIEAPAGYQINEELHYVNISDGEEIRIENREIPKVTVTIEKRDSETRKLITDITKFKVGDKILSTRDGIIEVIVNKADLPLTIIETQAPEGYWPPDASNSYTVPADIDGDEYTIEVYNEKIPDIDITVRKVDSSTGDVITRAAKFNISNISELQDTVDGEIKFTVKADELPITVEEIDAPEGYYLPEPSVIYTIEEDVRGDYLLEVQNEPIPFIDMSVEKVDENGEMINLPTTFNINGVEVTFTGRYAFKMREDRLPIVAREVQAPDGYYLDDTQYELSKDSPDLVVFNQLIPEREFTIVKVNDLDEEITTDSVKFRLDGNYMVDGILAASSDVEFTGSFDFTIMEDKLPITIQEVKAPDGHYLNDSIFTITKDSSQEIVIVNDRIPFVDFEITKVDEDGEPITTDAVEVIIVNSFGESGTIQFIGSTTIVERLDKLPLKIVEAKSPSGYYFDPDNSYTMDEGNTSLDIVNYSIPTQPITIRKVDEKGNTIVSEEVTVSITDGVGTQRDVTFTGEYSMDVPFNMLPLTVQEIVEPYGYYIDGSEYTIGVNASTYEEYEIAKEDGIVLQELLIVNDYIPYIPFTLIKVDEDGNEITSSPVTFEVDGEEVTFTGRYSFEIREDFLPITVIEVKAPDGYYKTITEYELYKEDRGNYEIVNSTIPHKEFVLTKVSSVNGKIIDTAPSTFVIDGREVQFTGYTRFSVREDLLPITLSEKVAPDGYYWSGRIVQVTNDTNSTIVFENDAIPYKDFTLIKVDKNENIINREVTFEINGENVTFTGSHEFSVRLDKLPINVQEVTAPTGYYLNSKIHELTAGSEAELRVVNTKKSSGGTGSGGTTITTSTVTPTVVPTDPVIEPTELTIEIPDEIREALEKVRELEELTDADRQIIEEILNKGTVSEEEYSLLLSLINDYKIPLYGVTGFNEILTDNLAKTGDTLFNRNISLIILMLLCLFAGSGMIYERRKKK